MRQIFLRLGRESINPLHIEEVYQHTNEKEGIILRMISGKSHNVQFNTPVYKWVLEHMFVSADNTIPQE